jgi:2-polyprenyl-3-methyl-5-hydroxy-6-metoxy-1,4-benzoquinol methylase
MRSASAELRGKVGARPAVPRACPMCGSDALVVHFTYAEQPPGETRFPLTAGQSYWREIHRCGRCGHFVERFDADQSALYSEEYVSALYGDADGVRRKFDAINAIPPHQSDNVGRVQFVDGFCRRYWAGRTLSPARARLLDVGAGLGVFPYRMKQAGWDCTTLEMDRRLVDHHVETIGVQGQVADIRDVGGIDGFDLITFNKVLEHVEDPIGMLRSAARLLAPAGLVYVELPDGEAAESAGKEREEFFLGHMHVFSFASYALLIMHAGFELVHCERLREPSAKFTLRGVARLRSAA